MGYYKMEIKESNCNLMIFSTNSPDLFGKIVWCDETIFKLNEYVNCHNWAFTDTMKNQNIFLDSVTQ